MIRSGTMRELIQVQVPVSTTNEFGESVLTWKDCFKCHAAIQQLTVAQLARANKAESQATYNVTIRWQNNLSLPLRVIWLNNKCRTMYVSSAVADDAKRTNIVLTCEERDDAE